MLKQSHFFIQSSFYPMIDADSITVGLYRDFLMQFGGNAHIEFAGKGLFRRFSYFSAKIKVVFNGISQCLFQFIYRTALESYNIVQIQNFTVKDIRIRIILKSALIAFISKYIHGVIPILSKKWRTDLTAPLSVTGRGCGR